ncbi:MAG: TetR/AcrR family transcriptional regulator [Jatrophihabitans sp.]|uniref:TetR/AcrR family transcriptional regulator n=1 Tax=Jatrophihabitans sp. TaxID=1932789 RepID=UPI003F82174A
MPPTSSPTRRTQRREDTLGEIRDAARALLAEAGPEAVTLRGIAARLGMAAAGVHYYYGSRDDLLTVLIIDAFDELADATARAASRPGQRSSKTQAWTAAALGYRSWAMTNPELFQFAHSATATRLKGRQALLPAKNRAVRALIDPLIDAAQSGEIRVPNWAPIPRALRGQLQRYADAAAVPADPPLQLLLLQAYTLVHGAVVLAVTGSLPRELLEDDALFRAQLARLLANAPRTPRD